MIQSAAPTLYEVAAPHDSLHSGTQGESAKGTSPSAALRTQREPLSSLGSHYPTIGLTPKP
ncbi:MULTISPECIES: hypothetical protein [Nitrincola]|uniref:hypothetical protein n=1 Tax=Nitrincola TaxID=267849 RepID=UPI0004B4D9D3|nr:MULTISPECIES: hypothetical protein [Nitrincola]